MVWWLFRRHKRGGGRGQQGHHSESGIRGRSLVLARAGRVPTALPSTAAQGTRHKTRHNARAEAARTLSLHRGQPFGAGGVFAACTLPAEPFPCPRALCRADCHQARPGYQEEKTRVNLLQTARLACKDDRRENTTDRGLLENPRKKKKAKCLPAAWALLERAVTRTPPCFMYLTKTRVEMPFTMLGQL